jgi:site-specific DNA-methyltransferase (adenine-specific)
MWQIATKAHYGNEHFAIIPEDLVDIILRFTAQEGDYVLDPFAGRGATGIVATSLGGKFVGIDLYKENIEETNRNILKGRLQKSCPIGFTSHRQR